MGKLKELVSEENVNKFFKQAGKTARMMKPIHEMAVASWELVIKASESPTFKASIVLSLSNIASVIESEALRTFKNHEKDFAGDLAVINSKMEEFTAEELAQAKEAREEFEKRMKEEEEKYTEAKYQEREE
jgi:hypothetical protein